jgi:hypothetical protein
MPRKPTSLAAVRNARTMQPKLLKLRVQDDILGVALCVETRGFALSRDFSAEGINVRCTITGIKPSELAQQCNIDPEAMHAILFGDGAHIVKPNGEYTEAMKRIAFHFNAKPEDLVIPMKRIHEIEASARAKLKGHKG